MDKDIKFWDNISKGYDKQVEKIFSEAYRKMISYTQNYLNTNQTVLDIGCGTGITTVKLAKYVKEIHALDLSNKMLEITNQKILENKIDNITLCNTDIFSSKFNNKRYDVITAFNILCYVQDDTNFMSRIYELLNDGGLFISVTDCLGEKETIFIKVKELLAKIHLLPRIKLYTMAELETKVSNCKYKILQKENLHTSPPNYYIVAQKTDESR